MAEKQPHPIEQTRPGEPVTADQPDGSTPPDDLWAQLRHSSESLPQRRLAVKVNAHAAAAIRSGHPWLYSDAVTNDPIAKTGRPTPGELGVIFDPKGRFCGIGLYDHTSPIRVRVLQYGEQSPIDDAFWSAGLRAAAHRRRALIASSHDSRHPEHTTAFRLINGEGDGFGGLIIDTYDHWLVVKVYSDAWLPHLYPILKIIETEQPFGFAPDGVVIRFARSSQHTTQVTAEPPPTITIHENGLRFDVDIVNGQKTGHFLDQRDNRQRVRDLAKNARVLDLFCCNGGFGVYASAGEARLVHSVDISSPAIASARHHMDINRAVTGSDTHHMTTVGDTFDVLDSLRSARTTFDLIVCDPPSFAHTSAMVPGALRAYQRLAEGCLSILNPGGMLVQSSCTSRVTADDLVQVVDLAAAATNRSIRLDDVTGHAVDHPTRHLEGRYLKTVYAHVT